MSTTIRVLVADPSAMGGEQTSGQFLGRPGVEVVQVTDGPAAVAALDADDIDIAIIDQRLPRLDGKAVRSWTVEGGRRTLLLLTADRLAEQWSTISAHVRAYDTLLKPVRRPRADTVLATYRRFQVPSRALVVDGTLATMRTISNLLRQSRFEFSIEEIDTGLHAVRIVELDRFDVALIALHLDDLPGLEVASRISGLPNAPPVVLMGGPGDRPKMADATLEAFGAKAYVRMPFTVNELDAALHSTFGLWRPYLAKALSDSRVQPAA